MHSKPYLQNYGLPPLFHNKNAYHFRVHSLDGFGCGEMTAALGASGAVLHYLGYQLRRPTDHLRRISVRATENAVLIDQASQRNLDLVDSRGGVKLSLLGTLDRTSTPMGARKLRDWLLHPLSSPGAQYYWNPTREDRIGVCMGNGREDVKRMGFAVCGTNQEDGVARYIQQILFD